MQDLFTEYKKVLEEFIKFKSISTDPNFKSEIERTVAWLKNFLEENGFEVQIFEGYQNPIILATFNVSNEADTVLLYGHYDVQPASITDGWTSDPFILTERDGKLYARGVADNKGQFLIHLIAIINLAKQKRLKYNIKFLLEGNEETGSDGMSKFISDHKDLLQSDIILISDGEMPYKPVITASFRGTFNVTLKVKTASNNLHSGLYGGPTPNAALELVRILNSFWRSNYTVDIENFYDKDQPITPELLRDNKLFDKERESVLKHTGVKHFHNYKCKSFSLTVGLSTMFTITGLQSGYTKDGYSNIIPNEAFAKLNFRIAAGQDPREVLEKVKQKVAQVAPSYIQWEFTDLSVIVPPVMVDVESHKFNEVKELLKNVYNDEVLIDYCGATLPIVVDIKKQLEIDPLLISLANDDCNMHGVDENFDINLIKKGLDFATRFFGISK